MKCRTAGSVTCLTVLTALLGASAVQADEMDDRVKKACAGLSAVFNSAGTKSDALDDEIMKDIDNSKAIATIVKRAQFVGSALVCGENAEAALARLESQAAAQYAKGSSKAKRFAQVVTCTEARSERSAASHWASPDFCPLAKKNYDLYVVREQQP